LVALIVIASARVWVRLLAGRPAPALGEEPYVPLAPVDAPAR
jgi:hypothetical protein